MSTNTSHGRISRSRITRKKWIKSKNCTPSTFNEWIPKTDGPWNMYFPFKYGYLGYLPSLKVTWPLKIGLPNRKVVFQPSIFRGELLVSGRVSSIWGVGHGNLRFFNITGPIKVSSSPHPSVILLPTQGDYMCIPTTYCQKTNQNSRIFIKGIIF